MQTLSDGRDHLLGRLGAVGPFQPGVVVGGHVTERGHLLAPQSARSAPGPAWQPDVFRLQGFSATPKKVREGFRIGQQSDPFARTGPFHHIPSVMNRFRPLPLVPVPRSVALA
jgi:hypothetical protein